MKVSKDRNDGTALPLPFFEHTAASAFDSMNNIRQCIDSHLQHVANHGIEDLCAAWILQKQSCKNQ